MGTAGWLVRCAAVVLVAAASAARAAEPEDAAAAGLLVQLQTLRAQVELYRLQHVDDAYPDFARLGWTQLTSPTDHAGTPRADGKYGPYLRGAPVNPLNGLSGIAPLNGPAAGVDELPAAAGFVFDSAGRLFATDATGRRIVNDRSLRAPAAGQPARPPSPPQTREAKLASTRSLLRTLQSQLALYQLQHGDRWPDLQRFDDWQQLTGRTNAAGEVCDDGPFGPYLRGAPRTWLTGRSKVYLTTAGRASGADLVARGYGYVFDPGRAKLWAIDADGTFIEP